MKPSDTDEQDRIVKIRLSEAEQRLLRVAAAIGNQSMAEFARQAVLEAARNQAQGFDFGGIQGTRKTARDRGKRPS